MTAFTVPVHMTPPMATIKAAPARRLFLSFQVIDREMVRLL
jgi:hypothetical protein